jgi:hypothetical protein
MESNVITSITESKSVIQSLILKHREEDINITPTKLNELYPNITKQIFSGNYVALKRRNWVKGEVVNKLNHATKRLNKLHETVEKQNSFGGDGKIEARQRMSDWALKSGVVGKCFSFSHKKAELEQVILKDIPEMTFLSVDNNKGVVKEMKRTKKLLNLPLEIHCANARGDHRRCSRGCPRPVHCSTPTNENKAIPAD